MAKKYNILLLTNRDSDNIGDQVIEACDIALIKAVMNNLEISSTDYTISSRAGSIVSKKYIETKDAELLKGAEKAIKQADVVICICLTLHVRHNFTFQPKYLLI